MPILVPNKRLIKPTTTPVSIPAIAKDSNTNPRPVRIAAVGDSSAGNPLVERTNGANLNRGYIGYQLTTDVPAGANQGEEGVAVVHSCLVEGFTGVVKGTPIWPAADATPDPESTFSGLTHTDPADGTLPIGVGATPTKIYFYSPQMAALVAP